jgi:hypothetical protein
MLKLACNHQVRNKFCLSDRGPSTQLLKIFINAFYDIKMTMNFLFYIQKRTLNNKSNQTQSKSTKNSAQTVLSFQFLSFSLSRLRYYSLLLSSFFFVFLSYQLTDCIGDCRMIFYSYLFCISYQHSSKFKFKSILVRF